MLFLAAEFPYPPIHGGRADTWRRIQAFSNAGVPVFLVCWYSDRRGGAPTDEHLASVKKVVSKLTVIPIELKFSDLIWRLFQMIRGLPSHVSARLPRGSSLKVLLKEIEEFNPGAVWVDGLWPYEFGRRIAYRFGWPCFYRSHNVEHLYMARQAQLADTFIYRLRLRIANFGLKRYEFSAIFGASDFFDISMDDLSYWKSFGLGKGHWLPPIVTGIAERVLVGPGSYSSDDFQIVFVGNLHTPNNVDGLRWLLSEVWPIVRSQRSSATLLIAGSSPIQEIEDLCHSTLGVRLVANPLDVGPIYVSARVLVNPVRHGSGVNIKSVEMLHYDAPIVSTSIGVAGLPSDVKSEFFVQDESKDFARAIVMSLDMGIQTVNLNSREQSRRYFSSSAINDVIRIIQKGS